MLTTAFIDAAAHPHAIPFYNLFPDEPTPPDKPAGFVTITKLVKLKNKDAVTLLDAIGDSVKKGGNVLIVMHGNDEGLFAYIGLSKVGKIVQRVMLQRNALAVIRRNAEDELDDTETAKMLMTSSAAWTTLKAQIARVQKLDLNRVDLRACNTGKNSDAMGDLKVFFNCKTLCAPTTYDSFGPIPFGKITNDPETWRKWTNAHAGAAIEGASPDRFALHYKVIGGSKVMLDSLAESEQAVKNWVKTHLPPGKYSKGPLFYHAFSDLQTLTFAGDAGFRAQLVEA